MQPLVGRVALVAGATRGAGRGIARMLGEAGATVVCTGRSSREGPSVGHHYSGRPETIEETAALVTAAGGQGIARRVDHHDEGQVAALFDAVRREHGRLDVLVNVLTGPRIHDWREFTRVPLAEGRVMLDGWLWPHITTCWYAVPMMTAQRSGLIVEVTEHESLRYHAQMFFDLAIVGLKRLMLNLAEELTPCGVAALTVAPGFMRTEATLERFGVTEETWREAVDDPTPKRFGWAGSESPCFVGRAIAALAADPRVLQKSGGMYGSWDLSDEYGFTDIDGERPHWGRYGAEHFPQFFATKPKAPHQWVVARS